MQKNLRLLTVQINANLKSRIDDKKHSRSRLTNQVIKMFFLTRLGFDVTRHKNVNTINLTMFMVLLVT